MSSVKIVTFAIAFGILYFLFAFWFGYWLGGFVIPFLGFYSLGYLTLRFKSSKMLVVVNSIFLILLMWYGLCFYLPIFLFIGKPSFFIYHFLSSIIIISHIIFLSFHHKDLNLKKLQEIDNLGKRIRLAKNLSREFTLILVIFSLFCIFGQGDAKERSFSVPIKNIQLIIEGNEGVAINKENPGIDFYLSSAFAIEYKDEKGKDESAFLGIKYDSERGIIYGDVRIVSSEEPIYIGRGEIIGDRLIANFLEGITFYFHPQSRHYAVEFPEDVLVLKLPYTLKYLEERYEQEKNKI